MTTTTQPRIFELAHAFKAARDRKKGIEQDLEILEGELTQIEGELRAALEADGVQSVKLEGVGTVYLEARSFARVAEGQLESLIGWLDLHNHGEIARRTIPHQTLTAWYKDQEEADKPLPPEEIVKVFRETKAKLRTTK